MALVEHRAEHAPGVGAVVFDPCLEQAEVDGDLRRRPANAAHVRAVLGLDREQPSLAVDGERVELIAERMWPLRSACLFLGGRDGACSCPGLPRLSQLIDRLLERAARLCQEVRPGRVVSVANDRLAVDHDEALREARQLRLQRALLAEVAPLPLAGAFDHRVGETVPRKL